MVMKIEPLSDALGAKVTNLNLEKEVADSDEDISAKFKLGQCGFHCSLRVLTTAWF